MGEDGRPLATTSLLDWAFHGSIHLSRVWTPTKRLKRQDWAQLGINLSRKHVLKSRLGLSRVGALPIWPVLIITGNTDDLTLIVIPSECVKLRFKETFLLHHRIVDGKLPSS